MNVDTSFVVRRREKQINFERSVLRELSFDGLKKYIQEFFIPFQKEIDFHMDPQCEEGCYDVAVEAYLLGSRYSRLGYYGLSLEEVLLRSMEEREYVTAAFIQFLNQWDPGIGFHEVLCKNCQEYVDYWWSKGFTQGKIKYKMKIH